MDIPNSSGNRRNRPYLRHEERFTIQKLLQQKTTVKQIAEILGRSQRTIYREKKRGAVLHTKSDLTTDILFIDEIHRLSTSVEEYLYSAMEDFFIDIVIDQGPGGRSVRLNIQQFTLIGATTRSGLLSAPLRSRFALNCRLDYYKPSELVEIIMRSAKILKIDIDHEGAEAIASRSRGTPRVANNLLRWARDYAQVKANSFISGKVAIASLKMLNIDDNGLDEMDNRILEAMIYKFSSRPVGIKNLAVAVGEEEGTIEEVYEPFLIQEGYMVRTPQGRIPTDRALKKFGLTHPPGKPEEEGDLKLF